MKRILLIACLWLFATSMYAQEKPTGPVSQSLLPMSNAKMEAILKAESEMVEGNEGYWRVLYGQRILVVVTDEKNNRMRIMTPVTEEKEIKKNQYKEMLQAQFHKALDVKYALFDGVLWSMFVHPLKELTEDQLKDAMSQVYFAANNFGSNYKSTPLEFGAGDD